MTFIPKTVLFYSTVFFSGALFAIGLQISSMVEPGKVKGFLDISGAWDPSLALVLFAALSVFSIGFALLIKPRIAQNKSPIAGEKFHLPTAKKIDKPLILGAAMFGTGWGIAGLCPGPTIVNLVHLDAKILVFFITMLLGMKIAHKLKT
jgi:uncharacterized membrane protein YedE/YeeE